MDFTPILFFETGAGILLVAWLLCAKPEYGLFLYGLALGFPDAAIPLGTAINLRLDDALILLFLLRTILWTPAPSSPGQRKILWWQASFLFVCFFSAAVGMAQGTPPGAYETMKMIGMRRDRVCTAKDHPIGTPPSVPHCRSPVRRRRACASDRPASWSQFGQFSWRTRRSSKKRPHSPHLESQYHRASGHVDCFRRGFGMACFSRIAWTQNNLRLILHWIRHDSRIDVCARNDSQHRRWIRSVFWLAARLEISSRVFPDLLFRRFLYALGRSRACGRCNSRGPVNGRRFESSARSVGHGGGSDSSQSHSRPGIRPGMGVPECRGEAKGALITHFCPPGWSSALGASPSCWRWSINSFPLEFRCIEDRNFKLCGALVLALIAAAFLDSFGLPTLYWEKLPTISLSFHRRGSDRHLREKRSARSSAGRGLIGDGNSRATHLSGSNHASQRTHSSIRCCPLPE